MMAVLVGASGCTSMGVRRIGPDRLEYGQALAQSWKNQILLNIVRIRYYDAPVFVEVTQIIGGYSVEHTGVANYGHREVSDPRTWLSDFGISAGTKYTDRPTITYRPLTGSDYVSSMMSPIPPSALLMLMEVGWPADKVFAFGVQRVNGLDNRLALHGEMMEGDSNFARLLKLLYEAQAAGAIGARIVKVDQVKVPYFEFREQNVSPEILAITKEIRTLLKLNPDESLHELTFGGVPKSDRELSIRTRSVLQMLIAMGSYVDVPQKHVDEGRAWPAPDLPPNGQPHIRVHSGLTKPAETFAEVKYRGRWYWVSDTDRESKPALSFVTMVLSVIQPSGKQMDTVLTVTAN